MLQSRWMKMGNSIQYVTIGFCGIGPAKENKPGFCQWENSPLSEFQGLCAGNLTSLRALCHEPASPTYPPTPSKPQSAS